MEKLLPKKLYAAVYWTGKEWKIIRMSIYTKYENTKKWVEDNIEWVLGKEYLIVEYEAR